MVIGGCVVYCLNVTSRGRKAENSSQEGEDCKIYGFTAPNGVISTNKATLQDILARKAICSQLETLEKRAIIYNFIL